MRKLIGALLAGALILGACADDPTDPSENPKQALLEALESRSGESFALTMSIDSDMETLTALAERSPDPPPPEVLQTVLDASIYFAGNGEEDPEKAQGEIAFLIGDDRLAEMVIVGYDLYARADVDAIVETFDLDTSGLDAQMAKLPAGMEFVDKAVQGEWIHLTGLQQLAAMSGNAGAGQMGQQQEQMLRLFEDAFRENSEVTEGDEEGPGTNLQAEVAIKPLMQRLIQVAQQQSGQVPAGQLAQATQMLEQLPDGDAVFDTWVEDGELTQLSVDFIENAPLFEEAAGRPLDLPTDGELALTFELGDFHGEVETPEGAVEVSFQQILAAMMSGAMQSGSSTDPTTPGQPPGDPCAEIAKLPAAQQAPFKDICPKLGKN